jgi:transposase
VTAVGIDIGKRHHQACFLDEAGKRADRPLRFPNTGTGVGRLEGRLRALPDPVTIGLEATGHYWLGLQRRLAADGYAVRVFNPLQAERFRKTNLRPAKTDPIDAASLAELVRIGKGKASYVPDDATLVLRELTRFRRRLVERVGDLKRQMLTTLDRVFPEFADTLRDPFGASARALLDRAASAAEFAALDLDEMAETLRKASRGRWGRAEAEALHAAAGDSLGVAALGEAARLELRLLIQELRLLEANLAEADRAITDQVEAHPTHLTSIPGVGPVLAAILLAEIGDPARFAKPASLVAFAGIDPSVHQSGQFTGTRRHLSKRGSPYLRYALFLAANQARQRDPDLAAYYARRRARGDAFKPALVATMHKLLARVYVVLQEDRPYEIRQPDSQAPQPLDSV